MSAQIHWMEGNQLPSHKLILFAVPGLGNVGTLVLDTLVDHYESTQIAMILHPDLPPHATLSDDGLLIPPHLGIHSVALPTGETMIAIIGIGQPMVPRGQHEVAESILGLAEKAGTEMLLVLAGQSAEIGEEEVHITCASADVRNALTEAGISIATEHPRGGMLGLAGLLVSLAPLHGVPSASCAAQTIGTSVDVLAADRLARRISLDFGLGIDLPIDNTSETAARLISMMEGKEIAGIDLSEEETGAGFYA